VFACLSFFLPILALPWRMHYDLLKTIDLHVVYLTLKDWVKAFKSLPLHFATAALASLAK
jgi:hypothetical protein